jgi:hypothetical protein
MTWPPLSRITGNVWLESTAGMEGRGFGLSALLFSTWISRIKCKMVDSRTSTGKK